MRMRVPIATPLSVCAQDSDENADMDGGDAASEWDMEGDAAAAAAAMMMIKGVIT